MIRAGLAIGLAVALAGCSQPLDQGDIAGVYSGTLENGQAYRLEMSGGLDYRFCRPEDTRCAEPELLGSYQVVRLGARLVVAFDLLCIAPDGNCKTYEADAKRGSGGSVELAFTDPGGSRHVFVQQP